MADKGMGAAAGGAEGLEPAFLVRWRGSDGWEHECTLAGAAGAWEGRGAAALGLSLEQDPDAADNGVRGTAWRLTCQPRDQVTVVAVEAVLDLDLASCDALFLNGYNSWTDSVERPADAATPTMGPVAYAGVRATTFDGSGDYRFFPQDGRRGHQHGWGYGYLRYGDRVRLVGSLDEALGQTALVENYRTGTLTLRKEPPARPVAAGEARELMAFCLLGGTLDRAVEAWLALAGVTRMPGPALVGYSSWYRHYTDISEKCLLHDLVGVSRALGQHDLGAAQATFQVDDGYTKVGDWLAPDASKFPHGMAPVAAEIRSRGLLPGIWLAPFLCERESKLFSEHPSWLLRDEAGQPVATGGHWSGGVALDTLNPEVRDYVRRSLSAATREWGFRLLKLDFLYAACMLAHGGLNRGELMADALDLIWESVPEGTLVDLCGVPIASALGRGQYCRIGCDVGLDWDDQPWMRLMHRERVSTRNSLANTRGRAHLDGRAWRNDPDVFFLRGDVRLTERQRHDLLEADASLGGVFFTSDDMDAWGPTERAAYATALADFVGRA